MRGRSHELVLNKTSVESRNKIYADRIDQLETRSVTSVTRRVHASHWINRLNPTSVLYHSFINIGYIQHTLTAIKSSMFDLPRAWGLNTITAHAIPSTANCVIPHVPHQRCLLVAVCTIERETVMVTIAFSESRDI